MYKYFNEKLLEAALVVVEDARKLYGEVEEGVLCKAFEFDDESGQDCLMCKFERALLVFDKVRRG